jgi:hypothetical protein
MVMSNVVQMHRQDAGTPLVIFISRETAARLHALARDAGAPPWKLASELFAELMNDDAAAHGAAVSESPTPFAGAPGLSAAPALLHVSA